MKLLTLCLCALVLAESSLLGAQGVPALPLRAGSISGVVRMSDGTPAAGVRVSAVQSDAADSVTAMASQTTTDNMGRYRLEGVPPGRYFVAAGRVDLPTYYPGTLNISAGTAVQIASAATVTDIDFVIQNTSASAPPNRKGTLSFGPNFNGTPFIQLPNIQVPKQFPQPPNSIPPVRPRAAAPFAGNLTMQHLFSSLTSSLQSGAPWWTNANVVRRLGLTADQRRKIETISEQHRQTITQNNTDLEREEASLAAMLNAEPLDAQKASAQIDKVIKARVELEKTTSNMTLEMRQVLTQSQWADLQVWMPNASLLPLFVLPTR